MPANPLSRRLAIRTLCILAATWAFAVPAAGGNLRLGDMPPAELPALPIARSGGSTSLEPSSSADPWLGAPVLCDNVQWRDSGCHDWASRYRGSAEGLDTGLAVATSPDGSRVYSTGLSWGGNETKWDAVIVANDATTGEPLWATRYAAPALGTDVGVSLAADPSGQWVFVGGYAYMGPETGLDYLVLALAASDGSIRWTATYDGPGHAADGPSDEIPVRALALSPDGATAYLTGTSWGGFGSQFDVATVAFETSTGAQVWAARYDGAAHLDDGGYSIAASGDGSRIYVSGISVEDISSNSDALLLAYDAATGQLAWARHTDGPGHQYDDLISVSVDASGSRVFATGVSVGDGTGYDVLTQAYEASDGTLSWERRYDGGHQAPDSSIALQVSPDGSRVWVGGSSMVWHYLDTPRHDDVDYLLLGYDASDGDQVVRGLYDGAGKDMDLARALGVAPDGSLAFLTGRSRGDNHDYGTVAFSTTDGGQAWRSRYSHAVNGWDHAFGLAVDPLGRSVYVTGQADGKIPLVDNVNADLATVAYNLQTGGLPGPVV